MARASNALRLLVFVLLRGGRPETPGTPVLRRVRMAVLLLMVPVVLTMAVGFGPLNTGTMGFGVLCAGLATAVPVVVAVWRPLVAWRLVALLLLVTPGIYASHTDLVRWWGWPWTMGLLLAAAVVGYVLAESYPLPVLVVAWGLTTGAMAPHLPDWRDLALISVLAGAVLILGNAVRLRQQSERERYKEERRAATLEERTRIARELHDVVTHHMAVLALRADSASFRLPDLPQEARAEFALLQKIARDGLTEMRRMLGVLRADDDAAGLTPQPELREVEEMVERFRSAGTEITLSAAYGTEPLSAGVSLSAYRIVQEALSNSARHAPGGAISVDIVVADDQLRVSVRNDPGARPSLDADEDRRRHGLLGMRKRARMLGGTLTARPRPDGGFVVVAALPLDGESES